MFLAASPYFQRRFSSSPYLLKHFASYILSVSTLTNLVSMTLLTHLQRSASYPFRIFISLCLNIVTFTLLAFSTTLFRSISAEDYFAFLVIMVFTASLATGFCQNGVFAYASGFGMSEYTQAIMTGQAIAGVLPCIAQIVSVLSVPAHKASDTSAGQESSKSAFAYFLTATLVSTITLVAFAALVRMHRTKSTFKATADSLDNSEQDEYIERRVVSLWTLFKKLRFMALAVFVCFAASMVFPVFTQRILSVRSQDTAPRLLQPSCFIPLGFLLWNLGDLVGRLVAGIPRFALIQWPRAIFLFSILRLLFIPLYLLCNIRGRGAVVESDAFYLFVVQFFFGATNGYIGSICMMGASVWVHSEEREAAGGFMGLMLVGGLTVGSLLSFFAA